MKGSKRLLICALLVALFSLIFSAPALADTDYLTTLKQDAGLKRTVALCALSGGTPNLAVLSYSGKAATELMVYADGQGAPEAFDLKQFSLEGVKSVSMQLRRDSSKAMCLTLGFTDVQGKQTTSLRLGLTRSSGNGALMPVYVARQVKVSGKSKYYVDGEAVSSARFAKEKRTFESTYKKVGALPKVSIASSDKASAITSKFNQLTKRYKTFSTVKTLKISKSSATMTAGKALKLSASIAPASAVTDALTWTSSNENIATVDKSGNVKGIAAGSATISVQSAGGKKKSCKLTVKGPQPTKVELDKTVLTLIRGESGELSGTVSPEGASSALTWTSSNTKVITVSKTGALKAVGKGKAVVTAKTANKKSASCQVVVNAGPAVIVDIAQHNYKASMDWEKIANNVDLLILRCGVTRTQTAPIGVGKDDKFAFYAKKCKEYGIPFGVYFYGKCKDEETAKKEAKMTWDVASPYKPLFYVYDAEESRLNKDLIETYIRTLKSLGAKKTGYYIAHNLYSTYNLDTSLVDFIWIPRYGKNTGFVDATPNYACDLHQYTSLGKIPGFGGPVDISRLMGGKSLEWFLSR